MSKLKYNFSKIPRKDLVEDEIESDQDDLPNYLRDR